VIVETTDRLRIIAGTRELAEAEIHDKDKFARLLGASIPVSWPPENLRDVQNLFLDMYNEHPQWQSWLTWYAVKVDAIEPILCGGIGFKGPADKSGMVEIGYSVLPEYQGEGLATEMVKGIVRWAHRQLSVKIIEAEVKTENIASIRVLEKNSFVRIGVGLEDNTIRFRYKP
jgi:ribosomal-protein-alanine N-acetyltransferase